MRGILNPVAVKVGPGMTPAELQRLIRHLDPDNSPGRLTLITRFGAEHIEKCLPPLAAAARRVGKRGALVLRSHARQYGQGRKWKKDPAIRSHSRRAGARV